MRALWRASIWAPGAIPPFEGELAGDMKRWVLPTYDVVLIFAAVLALRGGMPSFALVYDAAVSDVAAWALLTVAALCLAGVAFPRLWVVEFVAKCALLGILGLYAVILTALALGGDPARGFVAGASFALCVLPVWRIVWLGRERRRRRLERRAAARAGGS